MCGWWRWGGKEVVMVMGRYCVCECVRVCACVVGTGTGEGEGEVEAGRVLLGE